MLLGRLRQLRCTWLSSNTRVDMAIEHVITIYHNSACSESSVSERFYPTQGGDSCLKS